YRSLTTVTERLGLPVPGLARVDGPRALAWGIVWPERVTLLGSAGTHRSRRHDLIPFLARGRLDDALRWGWRRLFPPAAALALVYGDLPGPHTWRTARRRLRSAWLRHVALRARRENKGLSVGQPTPPR